MMNVNDVNGMGEEMPSEHAVSLYGQQEDALDDFPVLKAFQQYVNAEQAKARKRMVALCAVFGVLLILVVTVSIVFLVTLSIKNQSLNDRLIEYAMKDRDRAPAPAAVVQPAAQDDTALRALTAKLDDMQKKLDEAEAARVAAIEAAKPKEPTAEEKEIQRLQALLEAEKKNAAIEKEKKRQAELEAYRRKHYPELYETAGEEEEDVEIVRPRRKQVRRRRVVREPVETEGDDDIEALLKDVKAIRYFDDEKGSEKGADEKPAAPAASSPAPAAAPARKAADTYKIPVNVKNSSGTWSIPND